MNMKLIKYIKAVLPIIIFNSLITISAFAQEQNSATKKSVNMDDFSKLSGAIAFLLIAFLFIVVIILSLPKYEYSSAKKKAEAGALLKFWRKITQSVPIEKETDIVLEHDFDGIRELDNKIPPWYNALFFATIVFAFIYFVYYHVTGSGKLMSEEYRQEVVIADQEREELLRTGAFINEETVTLLTDPASLDNGKATFNANCVPCHGPGGGGVVGPNLTDDYWIHGGGIKNIFKTIKYGVPAKGMITWGTQMNPKKMQEVASYVISLHGTNPPNAKPPEGQLWFDSSQTKIDSTKINTTNKSKDSIKTDTTKKVTK